MIYQRQVPRISGHVHPWPLAIGIGLMALSILAVQPACAVMITTGDGSGNTDAGGNAAFEKVFGNLSTVGNGTAIYIGNGFALRTKHAGNSGSDPIFGQSIKNSTRLHEVGDPHSLTDIVLIELHNNPELPTIPIAESLPADGTLVRLIGFGANREPNITHWNVTGDFPAVPPLDVTWIWSTTPSARRAELSGYLPEITSGEQRFGDLRWGTNILEKFFDSITFDFDMGPNNGVISAFAMDFDQSDGVAHESQAVGHDSGGAVVASNPTTGDWELVGLIHASISHPDQPDPPFTAVFGNLTIASDLSSYRDQFISFIPEPACGVVMLATFPLVRRARRNRRGDK